jgi:hypothetical protein
MIRLWAGRPEFDSRVQTASDAHPTSYPVKPGGSYPRVKRPGREADLHEQRSVDRTENIKQLDSSQSVLHNQ